MPMATRLGIRTAFGSILGGDHGRLLGFCILRLAQITSCVTSFVDT